MSKLTVKTFKTLDEVKAQIKSKRPSFFQASKTSTVIPYQQIEDYIEDPLDWCDISTLPKKCELINNTTLRVTGPVSWQEARDFLQAKNLTIKTAPTEELASILAGAATSATGERCFHYGNLRSQISRITYLNHKAQEVTLTKETKLCEFNLNEANLKKYQEDFKVYQDFKNAPYPRLETGLDVMIGSEGQLGVITSLDLSVTASETTQFFLLKLPRFEEEIKAHLEVYQYLQQFRSSIIIAEMIDSNGLARLPDELRPFNRSDGIFIEVKESEFEKVYEEFLSKLSTLSEDDIFELTHSKFQKMRAEVPRLIWEENSKNNVKKIGTDIQVRGDTFEQLLKHYQAFTKLGLKYTLFGHFGDAHLHFNFLPQASEYDQALDQVKELYHQVAKWQGSPFAEHGIGILKQPFIGEFWSENQLQIFKDLKATFDPYNQFFPYGFLSL